MSSTLRNGESRDLNLTASDYITLVAVSGTYTATVVRGNSAGTVLGTNVTGGTYGPYTGGAVIRVVTSASSEVDFDIGASPVIVSDTFVTASTNPVTGGISLSAGGVGVPVSMRGDEDRVFQSGQPFGITRPVINPGSMFSDFSGTRCTAVSAPNTTLTNDYTGYDVSNVALPVQSITGLPSMLKLAVASDATQQMQIINSVLGSVTTAGLIGFWVYADLSGKVGVGSASIGMDFMTSTGYQSTSTRASWNQNQIRHGWNFLVYKQTKDIASMPASEIPFLGLTVSKAGAGTYGDIATTPLRYLNIDFGNMNGCVLYFDSLWTGFSSQAQFVLGTDQPGTDTLSYAIPKFEQYGWKGYFATPYRVWVSGTKLVVDWSQSPNASAVTLSKTYKWDCLNHTVNHLQNGTLVNPGEIRYEIEASTAWYLALGMSKGLEFYASPQSSTSILAERIIYESGIKLQRHIKKSNVQVTQFGVDNLSHVGAIDMSNATSGFQKASLIKAWIDNIIAYGATGFPFWHGITESGDTGTGEGLTGNDLYMTKSAFDSVMDYLAVKETAGLCRVREGVTGFYYGIGR